MTYLFNEEVLQRKKHPVCFNGQKCQLVKSRKKMANPVFKGSDNLNCSCSFRLRTKEWAELANLWGSVTPTPTPRQGAQGMATPVLSRTEVASMFPQFGRVQSKPQKMFTFFDSKIAFLGIHNAGIDKCFL